MVQAILCAIFENGIRPAGKKHSGAEPVYFGILQGTQAVCALRGHQSERGRLSGRDGADF